MLDAPKVPTEKSDQRIPGTPNARTAQGRAETWARWVAMHWPEVRIVEASMALTRIAGHPRLHAIVSITLGHLLPADVHVEALPDYGSGRITLFSAAALRNGRYRYVTNAAAAEGDAHRSWTIRISPAREMPPGVEVAPATAPVELEVAAAIATNARPEKTPGIGRLQEVAS